VKARDPEVKQVQIAPVAWRDPRAVALRELMDGEMSVLYGSRFSSPEPDEVVAARRQALVVDPRDVLVTLLATDSDGTPLGHGALRDLRGEWEVKRLIVAHHARGRGIGRRIMSELETLARTGGAKRLVLQTGDLQPGAVALYERTGYERIEIYEPYVTAIPFSLCFEKRFQPHEAQDGADGGVHERRRAWPLAPTVEQGPQALASRAYEWPPPQKAAAVTGS
jgi:GNAT superfamily N-acetyltransferase